jgi:hypothetical protein
LNLISYDTIDAKNNMYNFKFSIYNIDSVEVESLLSGGGEESLFEELFRRVVGQFEVVDAGVDGGIAALACVNLRQTTENAPQLTETRMLDMT